MKRAVCSGLARRQPTVVRHLDVDKKNFLKRHEYVSLVIDLGARRILHAVDDRKATSLTDYFTTLTETALPQSRWISGSPTATPPLPRAGG